MTNCSDTNKTNKILVPSKHLYYRALDRAHFWIPHFTTWQHLNGEFLIKRHCEWFTRKSLRLISRFQRKSLSNHQQYYLNHHYCINIRCPSIHAFTITNLPQTEKISLPLIGISQIHSHSIRPATNFEFSNIASHQLITYQQRSVARNYLP